MDDYDLLKEAVMGRLAKQVGAAALTVPLSLGGTHQFAKTLAKPRSTVLSKAPTALELENAGTRFAQRDLGGEALQGADDFIIAGRGTQPQVDARVHQKYLKEHPMGQMQQYVQTKGQGLREWMGYK